MQTTHLGRTGLQVSRLCLGTMNFGPQTSEPDSFATMDRAREVGINFFDTADVYGWKMGEGVTEQIVGRWFDQGGGRRESWLTRRYLTASQELQEQRITQDLSDNGAIISRLSRNLRLRYVFRYEMEHLLALSGFEIAALHGWFDRRPFADDSSEMVWIARKA